MTAGEIVGLVAGCAGIAGIAGGFLGRVWKGGGKWQAVESELGGIKVEIRRVGDGVERLVEIKEEHAERITRVEGRVEENTRRLDRIKAP